MMPLVCLQTHQSRTRHMLLTHKSEPSVIACVHYSFGTVPVGARFTPPAPAPAPPPAPPPPLLDTVAPAACLASRSTRRAEEAEDMEEGAEEAMVN